MPTRVRFSFPRVLSSRIIAITGHNGDFFSESSKASEVQVELHTQPREGRVAHRQEVAVDHVTQLFHPHAQEVYFISIGEHIPQAASDPLYRGSSERRPWSKEQIWSAQLGEISNAIANMAARRPMRPCLHNTA